MLRTRGQRQRAMVSGWADLREELLAKVLELLQAEEGGLGFSKASATVRLVCATWKAAYDALVKRLVLGRETTDEAMGILVRRFPAVVSLEMKSAVGDTLAVTDQGVHAVSSLRALTYLDLSRCRQMTDEGLRAVCSCTALRSLNLYYCSRVTDEGMRAVSSLPALTSLDLRHCYHLTDAGVRAVSNLPALTSLDLSHCHKKLTDVGVRALSSLPALTFLNLRYCDKVTAAGVQALRNTTAAPSLHIESRFG
jgi:hypothetical protein